MKRAGGISKRGERERDDDWDCEQFLEKTENFLL